MNFSEYFYSILENKQLADKLYFKTGILDNDQKEKILQITDGDYLTKFICDIVAEEPTNINVLQLQRIYNFAKKYNRQIFPIAGLTDFSNIPKDQLSKIIDALGYRHSILTFLENFPSIAKRNLRDDIRTERPPESFWSLFRTIEYLAGQLGHLSNRDTRTQNKVLKKIFSSNIKTFEELSNVIDDKSAIIGGKLITKSGISKLVSEVDNDYEMKIVFKSNDAWVVRVGSIESIKKVGCNSLWCFTYGDKSRHNDMFKRYSYNNYVYVIIDWKAEQQEYTDEYLMVVVIEPLPDKETYYADMEAGEGDYGTIAYSLFNESIDIFQHLEKLNIPTDIFTFED